MIATIVPKAGFGDSIFLLMPEIGLSARDASSVVANLNSLSFDFVTRQKLHGTNLSWYLLEQLPVIAPDDYDRRFGETTARELVRDHVLRLTFTAHDMAPFARDLGYDGPPFTWDEEERRHLRARLDALYFHLYGLDREDADYVLSTFPIVRKQDEDEFGSYRTRELVLAYMNALDAGTRRRWCRCRDRRFASALPSAEARSSSGTSTRTKTRRGHGHGRRVRPRCPNALTCGRKRSPLRVGSNGHTLCGTGDSH